jgi:hypothetical protein
VLAQQPTQLLVPTQNQKNNNTSTENFTLIKPSNQNSQKIDTLGKDSLRVEIVKNVNISKDALEDPVEYEAKDSIIFDNKNNLVHLYREAVVKFQTIEVRAAYIVLNIKENIATAEPLKESNGLVYGKPDFKDRDQNFNANKMRYNFKTKKGIVYDVQTQQQNLYVVGDKTKFVSRDATADTSDTDVIYTKDAILTTCNAEHPHYGIRAQKLKVLANKLVVVGPSNVEIGGVPTPLWLPFGFYPVTKNKQTGLLFPTAYGFQPNLGLGFQGLGWYFPLGKHYNLQVRSDYYTRGNWGIKSDIDYSYKYRFSGGFNLGIITVAKEIQPNQLSQGASSELLLNKIKTRVFTIDWQHTQDAKANPYQTFSANVNIATNAGTIQRNLAYNAREASRNTLNSGVNFSKRFEGKPYSFASSFSHDQNMQTNLMNLGLKANFPMQTLLPLKRLQRPSLPDNVNKVLDQFTVNYNNRAEARLQTIDSLLLDRQTLQKIRTGLSHDVSASSPVNVLKYFQLSPNVRFKQVFFFDDVEYKYNDEILYNTSFDTVRQETIRTPYQIGRLDTLRNTRLTPVNDFSMGVGFNTTMFGTIQVKKGYFRGIRHKMNISASYNYTPSLIKKDWFKEVQRPRAFSTSANQRIDTLRYSIFQGGIDNISDPGKNPKATRILSMTLINNVELKVKGRKDTIAKKIRLLDNFSIPFSFDFSRDSMKLSNLIPMSINNNFFKGLINANLQWNVTPYERVKDRFGSWKYVDRKIWRTQSLAQIGNVRVPKPFVLEGGSFTVATGFTIKQIIDFFEKKDTATNKAAIKPTTQQAPPSQRPLTVRELPSIASLVENFRLSYNYTLNFNRQTFSGRDTVYTSTNSLNISGSIPLSKNWNLNIGNIGFEIGKNNRDRLGYIDIGISRDLHCWELAGSWQPTRQSFFFTIRVKQAPLDFLKMPIQKGNQGSFSNFGR